MLIAEKNFVQLFLTRPFLPFLPFAALLSPFVAKGDCGYNRFSPLKIRSIE